MTLVLVEVVRNIKIVTEKQNKIRFLFRRLVILEKCCTFASSFNRD